MKLIGRKEEIADLIPRYWKTTKAISENQLNQRMHSNSVLFFGTQTNADSSKRRKSQI